MHGTADAVHLLVAAIWVGGLALLVLMLRNAHDKAGAAWASVAYQATKRFSLLGIFSVGALLLTGVVNTWTLVGSYQALLGTDYDRLLVIKMALFAAMLTVAAFNRLRLMPALPGPPGSTQRLDALRRLTRNAILEIVLGLLIFAIVGVLGTLHPATHVLPTNGAKAVHACPDSLAGPHCGRKEA